MRTYDEWCRALRQAEPKTHLEYHVGNLMIDRIFSPQLDKIAKLMMALSDLGFVALYQKRIGHDMHYFVVPCYRPLVETGEHVVVDGISRPILAHGDLQPFRGSRGHEQGCIAEAETLAGIGTEPQL
jgi:hypothetical protein